MTELVLAANIVDPDGFYADLLAAHDGLSEAESHAFNARLVLVLANHIGNRDVLRAALARATVARGTARGADSPGVRDGIEPRSKA